jgi:hypothetical protein
MSTLEMPACLALLLVMANLALCLNSERRPLAGATAPPAIVTLDGTIAVALCDATADRATDPAPTGPADC